MSHTCCRLSIVFVCLFIIPYCLTLLHSFNRGFLCSLPSDADGNVQLSCPSYASSTEASSCCTCTVAAAIQLSLVHWDAYMKHTRIIEYTDMLLQLRMMYMDSSSGWFCFRRLEPPSFRRHPFQLLSKLNSCAVDTNGPVNSATTLCSDISLNIEDDQTRYPHSPAVDWQHTGMKSDDPLPSLMPSDQHIAVEADVEAI